jgi:hypothetical protein
MYTHFERKQMHSLSLYMNGASYEHRQHTFLDAPRYWPTTFQGFCCWKSRVFVKNHLIFSSAFWRCQGFKEKMEIRVILYACEGSSFRPFQTFGPSTLATSLLRGASNPEGSEARPLSYTKKPKSMFPFNDNNMWSLESRNHQVRWRRKVHHVLHPLFALRNRNHII